MEDLKIKTDFNLSTGDWFHLVAKGGFGAIPFVGGLAAEFFAAIIKSPLSKRTENWIITMYEELKSLEEKVEGFKIEKLSENEVFITMLLNASQIAVRTHREEKLKALRTAVLNSALPNSIEEDKQLIFLRILDNLTVLDLDILREIYNYYMRPTDHYFQFVIIRNFKDKGIEETMVEQSFCFLAANGLIDQKVPNPEKIGGVDGKPRPIQYFKNSLGPCFLSFIGLPLTPSQEEIKDESR